MRAKKSLGQNFLMHAQTAERIADASGVSSSDTVLEIGPGTGMLTRALLARAKKVIAVEADGTLADELNKTFEKEIESGVLVLFHTDIREFDAKKLPKRYTLVANIPYYITGELLRTFLTADKQPNAITFLVQKEVAIRIAREKKESLLSLSVKAYGVPHIEFTVPRGAFVPAPNVDSAVLRVSDISRKNFSSRKEENRFFEMIRAGFAHKRKRLAKNLEVVASPVEIRGGFAAAHLSENVRAEDLSLADWLNFLRAI